MPRTPLEAPRTDRELYRDALDRASAYVPEWTPESDDVGQALVRLYAELLADVEERVGRLPEKHYAAFFDTLGFGRRPPRPASLPLCISIAPAAGSNVVVPARTRAIATGPDGAIQEFELGDEDAFEATPATIRRVLSVDPARDAIYDHSSALAVDDDGEGRPSNTSTRLFDGEDRQRHALYVAHPTALTFGPGATVAVSFDSNVPKETLSAYLRWEYYGLEDSETTDEADWHPLQPAKTDYTRGEVIIRDITERLVGYDSVDYVTPAAAQRVVDALRVWVREPRNGDEPLLGEFISPDASEPARTAVLQAARQMVERDDPPIDTSSDARVTFSFTIPGEPVPTVVNGRESRWLRCRLNPVWEGSERMFAIEFGDIELQTTDEGERDDGLRPTELLYNDVPLPTNEGAFYPFGTVPRLYDTFYIASTEAFSNSGQRVTLTFLRPGEDYALRGTKTAPELSWEYWNGSGWSRLPITTDETDSFRRSGNVDVEFTVPTDVAPTVVSGTEAYWIRVRLVGGEYVKTVFDGLSADTQITPDDESAETDDTGASFDDSRDTSHAASGGLRVVGSPPRYAGIRIRYQATVRPASLVARNGLEFEDVDLGSDPGSSHPTETNEQSAEEHEGGFAPRRLRPFTTLEETTQCVYFGFDEPLTDGPVTLLFVVSEREYPEYPAGFHPRVRWERWSDSDNQGWTAIDVVDRSEGFTRTGIVSMTFPTPTIPTEAFGDRYHWIRARVTGQRFDGGQSGLRSGLVPQQPSLSGVYTNVGWAANVRTIDEEPLGSSSGAPNQSFTADSPPTLDTTVEVDEWTALTDDAREALIETDDVAVVTGSEGTIEAAWVRWTEVPNFDASGPTDRHYVVDSVDGEVRFGDGVQGRIPSRGRDNVRLSYRTGGGTGGNVPRDAIRELKSAIPFLTAVTNPLPADGGVDQESTAATLERAPEQLRARRRGVTAADIEVLARNASGRVARAKCLPQTGPSGESRPGWVTVLIVPETSAQRPRLSRGLRKQLKRSLADVAPAALAVDRGDRLVVRDPTYVETNVDVVVQATGELTLSMLERDVEARVEAFLHPLSGGPVGEGWWFGELPSVSETYALLEGLDGVGHVEQLSLTYRWGGRQVTVSEGDLLPDIGRDALACSGQHRVTARGGT